MTDPAGSPLLTDLYQLTMLQAYFDEGLEDTAVFEMYVRKLPVERNFLLACGLDPALDWLTGLRFTGEDIDLLRGAGGFREPFLEYLRGLAFTGDVDAMPEGTVFFAGEPLLRVVAPMPQAQLVESRLLNLVHFQTLIASKAARCVLSAGERTLVDFGMRRAHGAEAALLAARAAYIAGFTGTATALAGRRLGIPLYGTMAHSYITAHERELDAFRAFARSRPENLVLLIDTYDTEAAAAKVVTLAGEGVAVRGVRLDSGDLAAHARAVRAILDAGGLAEAIIFCSGNLDEHRIAALIASGAPIDGFGVGTHLDTSSDVPALDAVYKLQEYAGHPRRKRSEGKATWPGRKQVFRTLGGDGTLAGDVIAPADAAQPGIPLLQPVMRRGRRIAPPEPLPTLRSRAAASLRALPPALRTLSPAGQPYAVAIAAQLVQLAAQLDEEAH